MNQCGGLAYADAYVLSPTPASIRTLGSFQKGRYSPSSVAPFPEQVFPSGHLWRPRRTEPGLQLC